MKNKLKCFLLLLNACVMLSSCQTSNGHSATESISIYNDVAEAIDALLSSDRTDEQSICSLRVTETRTADFDGDTYTFSVAAFSPEDITELDSLEICGVSSKDELVVVHCIIEGYPEITGLCFGPGTSLRNARTVEIADGFQYFSWREGYGHMPYVETISIPASVSHIGTALRYFDCAQSQDSMERYSLIRDTWSPHLTNLQKIDVDPENTHYVSHDGILYEYGETSTQLILMCVPRSYPSADCTVSVQNGTTQLRYGAVYQCQTIQKLIVPDSVTQIADQAIVATEKNPLTVVCSRGSVAAEYVAEYGNQYYLTVEYSD